MYTFASHGKILSRLFCTLWLKDKINDWTDPHSLRNSEESSSASHRFQIFLSLDYSFFSLFEHVCVHIHIHIHALSLIFSLSLSLSNFFVCFVSHQWITALLFRFLVFSLQELTFFVTVY